MCHPRRSLAETAARSYHGGVETALTVIACYRPHAGKEEQLRGWIREHVPALRSESLVSDDAVVLLRADDGSFLEIFSWKSEAAARSAESNEVIQRIWGGMAACADFLRLTDLAEASRPFAHFHRVPPGTL